MKQLSNTKIIHGMVRDINRREFYWSTSYRLFRTLIYGEPFQLKKGNGNTYAPTAVYTYVRIASPDYSEYEVTFFGEYGSILQCDSLNITVHQNRDGSYNAKRALNTKTNRQIKPDLWCLPAVILRIIMLFILLFIAAIIIIIACGLPILISTLRAWGGYILFAIVIILVISEGGNQNG